MRHITSFISTISKGIAFCTSAAILALGALGPAQAIIIEGSFPIVGPVFNASQAVKINVSHVGDPDIAPAPCTARVQFFDGINGALYKNVLLKVPPGQNGTVELGVTELIPQKGKVPIYARVAIDDPNVHPVCRPSLEVFDKVSGRTAVAVGAPNFALPLKDDGTVLGWGSKPQGQLGHLPALTVATGEVMRVNVVNFEPPIVLPPARVPGPCTVQLVVFAANGTQVAEQRVTLAPGVGDFLDVGWDPNFSPPQWRATGSPIAGQCGNLAFSVEVYDAATGIATLHLEGDFTDGRYFSGDPPPRDPPPR